MKPDTKKMEQNLRAWADITSLCIELRKSVLREKLALTDDAELTRMVFAEAVARKEKAWKATKASPGR